MASISSPNVNEILPGLDRFLRSMLNTRHLNTDHRHIAATYLTKIDQMNRTIRGKPSMAEHQSSMSNDLICEEDIDDFTDEEEQEQTRATLSRHPTMGGDDHPLIDRSTVAVQSSDQYQSINEDLHVSSFSDQQDKISTNTPSRSSTSASSNVIIDGLLLTYDKYLHWICRYYVLDEYDLICFPSKKTCRPLKPGAADADECPPLWVSDVTNAQVHLTAIDQIPCLSLQIGLDAPIYLRPLDSNQLNRWFKVFRHAASVQKSKDKNRSPMKNLSRNARRFFAQFTRKKDRLVSHLLDQVTSVTRLDDKTRPHYDLRGFLVVSLDNQVFQTKYCTIVNGVLRLHKSRLSEQTEHQIDLNQCQLSFPREHTREIQFALTDKQCRRIFIRGNNIYSMGRLLNTLAKYVQIIGSSPEMFESIDNGGSSSFTEHESKPMASDLQVSTLVTLPPSGDEQKPSLSVHSFSTSDRLKMSRQTTELSDEQVNKNVSVVPSDVMPTMDSVDVNFPMLSNTTEDRTKSYEHILTRPGSTERDKNFLLAPPQTRQRTKMNARAALPDSRSLMNISYYQDSKRPASEEMVRQETPSISSSSTKRVFSLGPSTMTCNQQAISPYRGPYPLPRRLSTDYTNRFTHLLPKTSSFSLATQRHSIAPIYDSLTPAAKPSTSQPTNDHPSSKAADEIRQQSIAQHVYDIPIKLEHRKKSLAPLLRPNGQPACSTQPRKQEHVIYCQGYDNLTSYNEIIQNRAVHRFNSSASSAFTKLRSAPSRSNASSSPSSSTISSCSPMVRRSSSSSQSNLNTNYSNNRTTLMTAV